MAYAKLETHAPVRLVGDRRGHEVPPRFRDIDKRREEVDRRFDQVDQRFDRVDERFDALDGDHRLLVIAMVTLFLALVGVAVGLLAA